MFRNNILLSCISYVTNIYLFWNKEKKQNPFWKVKSLPSCWMDSVATSFQDGVTDPLLLGSFFCVSLSHTELEVIWVTNRTVWMTFQVLVIKDGGFCLAAASWITHSGRSQLPCANNAQQCSGEVRGERNGNFPATTTTYLSAMCVGHHGIGASSPSRAFRWLTLHAIPYKTLNWTMELSCSQIPDPQKPFELINLY